MAVWQFSFFLVPEEFLEETYGHVPTSISAEARREGDYFRQVALSIDKLLPYLKQIGTLDANSWEGSAYYHGKADNNATVYFEEETNHVCEIYCRLDIRQFDETFIFAILSLAAAFNCQFMTGNGQLFEPTLPALLQAIEQSNATRFVTDPLKFLEDLSRDAPAT